MINYPDTANVKSRGHWDKNKDAGRNMTFSIIARDPDTGAFGGATATANLAVGVFVLHLMPDVGAVATQGFSTNYFYGPHGLQMLREGHAAKETLSALTTPDAGRDLRQCIVLDSRGQTAGWTGEQNRDAAGTRLGENFAIAGNILTDASVLDAMRHVFLDSADVPLAERLIATIAAGQEVGGDRRGTSSAAVRVLTPGCLPFDLRVDDSQTPIDEIWRLYGLSQAPEYQAFLNRLPTPDNPHRG